MKSKGVLKRRGASLVTREADTSSAEARFLNQTEENALRMLYGIGVDAQDLLSKACGENEEVGDELLLLEMQLFRAARMQQSPAQSAKSSPRKSKIISALRAKR